MSKTVTRIYLVTQLVPAQAKAPDPAGVTTVYHLVEATSAATAIRHKAKSVFEAEVATGFKIAELVAKGVKLEKAKVDDAE